MDTNAKIDTGKLRDKCALESDLFTTKATKGTKK